MGVQDAFLAVNHRRKCTDGFGLSQRFLAGGDVLRRVPMPRWGH
jgi:hypothetical protein